jgi:phytoene dehydrogenase-like protein
MSDSYDVIVVGAGFGGSSSAALLAKRGLKVLLLDKNAKAGGKAMAFSKGGFTYTAWVVIAAPTMGNVFEAVLKELGMEKKVELVAPGNQGSMFRQSSGKWALGPQDPTPDPNKIFDWLEVPEAERADALTLLGELTLMSPKDVAALDDISFGEWLSQRKINKGLYSFLISLVSDGCFVLPVDSVAASEGITVVQQVFLRGGGVFCKGGIGRVAETYAEAVEAFGGKTMFRSRVEKINVEDGRVTGVSTEKATFRAPIVISNVGIQPTVLKLVGEKHFDKSYIDYVKDLVPSLAFIGARYFLSKEVIRNVPYGALFTKESAWSVDKWLKAKAGQIPEDMTVWFEVPSNYDPGAAPKGKQIVMTGFLGPCDPKLTEKDLKPFLDKGDEMMFKAFPDLKAAIEAQEFYTPHDVSTLTRDSVLPRIGGECIGLGQVVGQGGAHKPSVRAPIRGLFYVGCDAGGIGVGTQQATDSGMKVADAVLRYHRQRQAMI